LRFSITAGKNQRGGPGGAKWVDSNPTLVELSNFGVFGGGPQQVRYIFQGGRLFKGLKNPLSEAWRPRGARPSIRGAKVLPFSGFDAAGRRGRASGGAGHKRGRAPAQWQVPRCFRGTQAGARAGGDPLDTPFQKIFPGVAGKLTWGAGVKIFSRLGAATFWAGAWGRANFSKSRCKGGGGGRILSPGQTSERRGVGFVPLEGGRGWRPVPFPAANGRRDNLTGGGGLVYTGATKIRREKFGRAQLSKLNPKEVSGRARP